MVLKFAGKNMISKLMHRFIGLEAVCKRECDTFVILCDANSSIYVYMEIILYDVNVQFSILLCTREMKKWMTKRIRPSGYCAI